MTMLFLIAHAATETHQAAESAGLGALGLDVRALIYQVLNFAVLLVVLRLFAYKPILSILEQRRTRIAESLQSAQAIESAKAELAIKQKEILQAAQRTSQQMLTATKKQAAELLREAEANAQQKANDILAESHAKLRQEAASLKHELRHETLQLVAFATAHVIHEKLDPSKDAALIKDALQAAEKQTSQH